jgi:hypothetical protein
MVMTKEEIYKASDVLTTILDNYLHGGEAAEVVTKFEDELIKSNLTKEEPKKCMYSKDDYTDEDRKVLCDGCDEECKYSHSVNVHYDSKNYELIEATYYIPKDMCAIIEDDKVIIKKK